MIVFGAKEKLYRLSTDFHSRYNINKIKKFCTEIHENAAKKVTIFAAFWTTDSEDSRLIIVSV